MKKNSKSNRKSSRKSSSVSKQKLFRNGAHGFEALEPRQMLDAALTNALLDTPIPYTATSGGDSTKNIGGVRNRFLVKKRRKILFL